MSQVQRSTARSAVTNESFAVRQRAVPGPHGGDRRRPWSSRRPKDTARRSCVGLGGQSYPHRRRSTAKLAAAAKALAGRQRVAPGPHGGRPTSPLILRTIVQCDQATSRQPGSRDVRAVDARRRRHCRSSPRRQATRRPLSTRRSTDAGPGPHGDRPGDHASTPVKGGIRAVDGLAERSPLLAMSSSRQTLRTKLREKRREKREERKKRPNELGLALLYCQYKHRIDIQHRCTYTRKMNYGNVSVQKAFRNRC